MCRLNPETGILNIRIMEILVMWLMASIVMFVLMHVFGIRTEIRRSPSVSVWIDHTKDLRSEIKKLSLQYPNLNLRIIGKGVGRYGYIVSSDTSIKSANKHVWIEELATEPVSYYIDIDGQFTS